MKHLCTVSRVYLANNKLRLWKYHDKAESTSRNIKVIVERNTIDINIFEFIVIIPDKF